MSPNNMVSMWLLLCCLIATSSALNSTSIAGYIQEASVEKTGIFYNSLAKTHDNNGMEVTESFRWKLGTIKGTAASSFRSFGQSFILSDPYLYLISMNPNSSISLRSVLKIDQSSEVLFIESVEWRNVLFVLLAFKSGILHLLKVTDDMIYQQHKLSCCDEPSKCVPKAAEFFTQDGELYLVIISNSPGAVPVIFYQWKTADLDRLDDVNAQLDVEHVTSPTAVATFPSKGNIVVVVAREMSSKGGLSIYLMKRNVLNLVQILKSDKVVGLLPFMNKNQPQLLVLTSSPPSVIYAWNGKQLTSKTPVPSLSKAKTATVSYVDDVALLLIPKKNVVQLFSPSGISLGSSATVSFPAEVDSGTIHQSKDGVFLIVILKEDDGKLSSMAVQLNITVSKESEKITMPTDEVVTCFDTLKSTLSSRNSTLLNLLSGSSKLLLRGQAGKLSGKLVVNTPNKVVLRKGTQSTIVINPQDYNLTASPSQLKEAIISKMATAESVSLSLPGLVKKTDSVTWSSGLQGSLTLSTLKAAKAVIDNPIVNTLNKRGYAPERFLKYSKDQTLTGKISAENVNIDTAFVESLSGMNVEDLLWNSGVQQTVAIKEVPIVTAGLVNVESGIINNIPLAQVVRKNLPAGTLIRGLKEAPSLAVSHLGVGSYNNVDLTSWWNRIRPDDRQAKRKIHVTSDLSIKNLTVTRINDVELRTLFSSLFLLGKNQQISGTVKLLKKPSIVKLTSQNVAGKPSSNLMTVSSDQVFNGTVSFGALSASQLFTNSVNKLNLTTDVARINSSTVFTGYVAFNNVFVKELELPPNTYIMGQQLSPYFLQGQRQVYRQPVRIRGTLKVADLLFSQTKMTVKDKPVSIKDLPSIFWTKNSPQVIPTAVLSRSPLVVDSVTAQTVNGIPPKAFLHCDTLESLAVPWWIPSAMIVGDVNHLPGSSQSPLNPTSLLESVVLTSGNFEIQGDKVFTGGIQVHKLRTNLLDEVNPNNAALRSSSTLPGENTWDQIQIKKDLIIEADLIPNKTNSVDLCSKILKAVKIDEPATIKSILMNTAVVNDLSLGVVNGVPLKTRRHRSVTPQLRRLVVKGKFTVPELQYVDVVNNIKLNEFLPFVVNKTTGAVIEGSKSFLHQVTVEQDFYTSKVNGVELNAFVGALLSRTRAQTVTARYSFDAAEASSLDAWQVNNVEIGKMLTSDALLGSAQIFGNLRFSQGLRVGDLTAASILNACDVKKIVNSLSVINGGSWSSLKIDGDLSWQVSRVPMNLAERGLGYLLDSAVKKTGDNEIVGVVTFAAPVGVGDIVSDRDIEDVALNFIKNDSLMKKSPTDQVIKSPVRFLENAQVSSLVVSGNIDVASINDIQVLDLNNSIVRKSGSPGPIRGRKVFLKGIKASKVICDRFLNDFVTSSIVSYDMPRLPPVELNATMEIVGNLNFTSINDLNIQQLLEERVTLDSQQTISGTITFVDDLVIKDRALVSNINNVDVSTVVTLNNPVMQVIYGPKVLTQPLTVEGPLELDYLNGLNFSQSVYEALLKDVPTEGATITGSVTFAAPVTVENDLTVDGTVNDITLDELQRRLQSKKIKYPLRAREKLLKQVQSGKKILADRRNYEEVMYLDSVQNLDIRVSNMSRVIARPKGDRIVLDVFGSDAERQCGLPTGCACPVQMSVELAEEGGKLVAGTWNKLVYRSFKFDVSDTLIDVSTTTVSRDTMCRFSPEESALEDTKVTWWRPAIGPAGALGVSVGSGYVSDVALLQYGDLIFVVIGLSYDPAQDTTNMNSKMLKFDSASNSITLAQEIPTFGASALNVFTVALVPYLVVGNSYDSVKSTTQVPLYIYRFNNTTYQLDVKRKIPTVGVVSVASLVDGHDAVIVVAQAQTNSPVLVFKYDPKYDSFKVSQQLGNIALPTGLGTFRISDGFVGLATADDIFRLYKYCHIQGLKLVQEYQKVGVRGFARFDFTKRYLFLTSSEESSLVELVVQGR